MRGTQYSHKIRSGIRKNKAGQQAPNGQEMTDLQRLQQAQRHFTYLIDKYAPEPSFDTRTAQLSQIYTCLEKRIKENKGQA